MRQLLSAEILGVHQDKLSIRIQMNGIRTVVYTGFPGFVEIQRVIIERKPTASLRSKGMLNIVQSVSAVTFRIQNLPGFILLGSPVDSLPLIVYLDLGSSHFPRGILSFIRQLQY